ncbi:MAG: hypothetical protein LBD60_00600, partial [Puniceicoccales bacterium]|nr:hypothetical protein [Puniceicoccales bacterium]
MNTIGGNDYFDSLKDFASDLGIEGVKDTKDIGALMGLLKNAEITATDNTIKVKIGERSDVEPKTLGNAEKLNSAILTACGNNTEIKSLLDSGDAKTRALIYTAFMKLDPGELQKAANGNVDTRNKLIQHLKETGNKAQQPAPPADAPSTITIAGPKLLADDNVKAEANKLFELLKKKDTTEEPIKGILAGLSPEDLKKVLTEKNSAGQTPLTMAAEQGNLKLFQAMIGDSEAIKTILKEALTQPNKDELTPLSIVASLGNVEIFKAIVDIFGNDNAKFKDPKEALKKVLTQLHGSGETLLTDAAKNGKSEVFEAVIAIFKDNPKELLEILMTQNRAEKTPLQTAEQNSRTALVEILKPPINKALQEQLHGISDVMVAMTATANDRLKKSADNLSKLDTQYGAVKSPEVQTDLTDNYELQFNESNVTLKDRRNFLGKIFNESEDDEIVQLNKEIEPLNKEIKTLEQEAETLKRKIGELEQEYQKSSQNLQDQDTAIAGLGTNIKELEEKIQASKNDTQAVETEISNLQQQINSLGQGTLRKTYTLDQQQKKEELEQEIQEKKEKLNGLKQSTQKLQTQLNEKTREQADLFKKRKSIQGSQTTQKKNLDDQQKALEDKKKEIHAKQTQLDQLPQELDARFVKLYREKKAAIAKENNPDNKQKLEQQLNAFLKSVPISERAKNQRLSMINKHLGLKLGKMKPMMNGLLDFVKDESAKKAIYDALSDVKIAAIKMEELLIDDNNINPKNRYDLETMTQRFAEQLKVLDGAIFYACETCLNEYQKQGANALNEDIEKIQSDLKKLGNNTEDPEYPKLQQKLAEITQIKGLLMSVFSEIQIYRNQKMRHNEIGGSMKYISQESLGTHTHDLEIFINFIRKLEQYRTAAANQDGNTMKNVAQLLVKAKLIKEAHKDPLTDSVTEPPRPTAGPAVESTDLSGQIDAMMTDERLAKAVHQIEAAPEAEAPAAEEAPPAEAVAQPPAEPPAAQPADAVDTNAPATDAVAQPVAPEPAAASNAPATEEAVNVSLDSPAGPRGTGNVYQEIANSLIHQSPQQS